MEHQFDNAMRRQVRDVPALLKKAYAAVEPRTREVLSTPEIYSVKKIVLTGCGDGYAAALCVRQAFERFLQIPVDVVDATSLARYYQMKWVGESPCDPLVIAVSNSGGAARVVEAVKRMRLHNALTLAVTAKPASALGQAAERTVALYSEPLEPAPGVCSFAVILMTLYLLAIRLGEVRLKLTVDQAAAYRSELTRLPETFLSQADAVEDLALAFSGRFADCVCAEMVGCGADGGTAWYGHAKMLEAAGVPCMYYDSENYFHVNCFLKPMAQSLMIVFAAKGNPAASRTSELVERLTQQQRCFALVTDDPALRADYRFLLPEPCSDVFLPMAAFLIPALVAGYLAALRNEPYSRGFQGVWKEEPGMYTPGNSAELLLD